MKFMLLLQLLSVVVVVVAVAVAAVVACGKRFIIWCINRFLCRLLDLQLICTMSDIETIHAFCGRLLSAQCCTQLGNFDTVVIVVLRSAQLVLRVVVSVVKCLSARLLYIDSIFQ